LESEGKSSRLHAFLLDVQNNESVEGARKLVEESLGNRQFYALVNNAGLRFNNTGDSRINF
jgi:hypothetical protein